MKSKHIGLVWLDPLNENKGVAALAYSVIHLLEKISSSKNLKFSYSVFCLGKSSKCKIKVEGRDITFMNYPSYNINSIRGILKMFFPPFWGITKVRVPDYVLDISAGDSFSDIYGLQRFKNVNGIKKVFRLLGKKQLFLPQTIGPFIEPAVKRQAQKSIEKTKVILTRDKMSFDYVVEHTKQRNVFELIDVAFFMPFTKKKFNNNKINVGLNVSALLWHGGYTNNNQFGLTIDYQKTIRAIIEYFLTKENVKLHLIPHVLSGEYSVENDYAVSRELIDEYDSPNMVLAPFFLDPIDAKSYISGLDFFAGARMHACIAAFSSGVPVFPMAYSRKFNGLFQETLQYPYLGDMVYQSESELTGNLKRSFENREGLAANIEKSMKTIVAPRYKILMEQLEKFLEVKR